MYIIQLFTLNYQQLFFNNTFLSPSYLRKSTAAIASPQSYIPRFYWLSLYVLLIKRPPLYFELRYTYIAIACFNNFSSSIENKLRLFTQVGVS